MTGRERVATISAAPTASAAPSGSPQASGLAGRYANALYAQSDETHELDRVVAEMKTLGQMIDQSADFRRLVDSPLVDLNQALTAARAVLQAQGFSASVQNFVSVVITNRRLRQLRQFITAFAALVAERRGIVTAHVISAYPLSAVQEQALRARLIEAGYSNVDIVKEIDPSLLGGLIVRVGTRLYDTSLKSRLQRLQYAMKGAA
jgi:F-type H+-transporting ATPase subunit delta